MKLTASDIVLSPRTTTQRAYVLGAQFGPWLLYVGGSEAEAYDVFVGKYGEQVSLDDPALADYDHGLDGAIAAGDVVITEDGLRWDVPYAQIHAFVGRDAVRQAGRYYRECQAP